MKKLLIVFCLYLGLPGFVAAQSNDYLKSVEELLSVSGSGAVLQKIIPSMLSMLKEQIPIIPDAYWNELEQEITKTAPAELAIMIVPVYRKYLSQEELNEIIAFYKTPAGQKLATVSPQISAELLSVGQQWGLQLSQKVLKQLQEKGYF